MDAVVVFAFLLAWLTGHHRLRCTTKIESESVEERTGTDLKSVIRGFESPLTRDSEFPPWIAACFLKHIEPPKQARTTGSSRSGSNGIL